MNTLERSLALAIAATLSAAGTPLSAQEVSTAKDLTAVIALQGQPCGQVVSVTRQGEDRYLATCQDGNRYRVFVDANGRVIVEKLN